MTPPAVMNTAVGPRPDRAPQGRPAQAEPPGALPETHSDADDSDSQRPAHEHLAELVVAWFRNNGRTFPWRDSTNPFHILVAEMLLRQTQAHRVVGPYLELLDEYPDPEALADARVPRLRRWFRPLGLVRRADSLVACARALVEKHSGQVPSDLATLLSLPGLGTYSARATLCLAYGQAVPMVDEGSGRVLRRILGREIRGPAYSRRSLLRDAQSLLPEDSAREFNLGLIDIAARFCRPRNPLCSECPLLAGCAYGRTSATGGRSWLVTH